MTANETGVLMLFFQHSFDGFKDDTDDGTEQEDKAEHKKRYLH